MKFEQNMEGYMEIFYLKMLQKEQFIKHHHVVSFSWLLKLQDITTETRCLEISVRSRNVCQILESIRKPLVFDQLQIKEKI